MQTTVHGLPTDLGSSSERLDQRQPVRRHARLTSFLTDFTLGVLLIIAVLVPRLHDLDALVTPDEPIWIARSANFYEALSEGDLRETYQFSHPGVTVMWLGAIAYRAVDADLADRITDHVRTGDVRDKIAPADTLPIDRLVDLRTPVVAANALVLLAIFLSLIPMVGRWGSLFSVAFLSFDPMQVGFARLFHLDGLSTNLLLLTIVSYTWYLQKHSGTALLVSGIAAGLALLTRSVNGILLPVMIVFAAVDIAQRARHDHGDVHAQVRLHIRRLALWGLVALSTVFALWPALWVAPIDTLAKLIDDGSSLASAPHTRQLLFRGEVITSDPGWIYYPIVLAYRMSPVTVVALALSAIALIAPGAHVTPPIRRLCFNLALFTAAYLLILSLAAKKLDRYLLPSLAAMDLIAAIGTIAFGRWLVRRAGIVRPWPAVATVACICALCVGAQAFSAGQSAPYYITYVSPLVGGQAAARGELSLEWGEGGKRVAEAILQHPEIGEGEIDGGAWSNYIDYYLPFRLGSVRHELTPSGAAWFLTSQYVVVTEPEIQRQFYSPEMVAWFDTLQPVAVVHDDGRVYARIFDLSGLPLPPPYYQGDAPIFDWGERARLVASSLRDEVAVGGTVRARLYFETTGVPFYYWIEAQVVDSDGAVVGRTDKRLRADEATESPLRPVISIDLPPELAPGTYELQISMRDDESGDLVEAVHVVTGQNARTPVTVGSFTVVDELPTEEQVP
jgi:hypothetical protein